MPRFFISEGDVGSAASALTVTPSDATVFAPALRGFYVGGAGNVTVRMAGSQNNVTFTAAIVGQYYPFQVDQIRATGTTATNIVGLF